MPHLPIISELRVDVALSLGSCKRLCISWKSYHMDINGDIVKGGEVTKGQGGVVMGLAMCNFGKKTTFDDFL